MGIAVSRARVTADQVLVAAAVAALAAYLVAPPPVPDLAAQVARADLIRRDGQEVWWIGWFGGVHLPSYSLTGPALMSVLGVTVTGALATALSVVAFRRLVESAPRRRLGTAAFLVTSVANLLDGRITFAVALMTGLWCLTVLRPPMSMLRSATAGVLGVLTCVTSPLAGLFLAVAAGTMLLDRRPGRPRAGATWLVLGLLVTTVLVTVLLFPGVGVMPFPAANALPATACAVAVAALCPDRRIRIGACAYLVLLLLLLLHATAVGVNVTRLAWIFALPVTIAYARLAPRALLAVAASLALLPALDLAGQLQASSDPSARGSFYRPLLSALDVELASHPASLGRRVEVIDPRSHWSAAYLPGRFSLARGWERQMDRAANPMFYRDRPLTADGYRRWLHDMAVGWVALPTGPLDYASEREARLVARHPAYLAEIWSNENWRLYRVRDAGPLAWPATVVAIDDRTVTVDVGAVTTVDLALRWSPYLVVTDGTGIQRGCVGRRGAWSYLHVGAPGRYVVTADFDSNLLRRRTGCAVRPG